MKLFWKAFTAEFTWGQFLTLIIATLALIVSIKSCSVSLKAAQLSERDFSENRLITLKAEVDDSKEVFKISPTEGHLTFLKGRVFYPKQFDNTEWPIDAPEYKLYVTVLKHKLTDLINKAYPPDPKNIIILDDASIPLVIESQYIAKGISYFDKSLYRVEYMAVISGEKYQRPQITLKGLLFLGHLPPSQDQNELLSHLWDKIIRNRPMPNTK